MRLESEPPRLRPSFAAALRGETTARFRASTIRSRKAGRWHIVGGWWIQPDCNGPSGFGFEKQIELGREYFLEKFGQFPRIGYNVDSFGHAATLPGMMRKFGQDCYVFMRPGRNVCVHVAPGSQKMVQSFALLQSVLQIDPAAQSTTQSALLEQCTSHVAPAAQ